MATKDDVELGRSIRGDIEIGRPMSVNEDGVWSEKPVATLFGLVQGETPGFSEHEKDCLRYRRSPEELEALSRSDWR